MTGLTNEQVQQRIEEGKINANENPNTRSYKQIIRENVLTFFNFLNLVLLVRLPLAYFMSIQPDANLTKIGLAAPVATVTGIILNVGFYIYLNRTENTPG